MKQLFFAGFAAAAILSACSSKHTTSTTSMNSSGSLPGTTATTTTSHSAYTVPGNIRTTFTTQYPNATGATWLPYDENNVPIDWDLTDWAPYSSSNYTVSYTMNGNKYYTWYDANGNWIGTSYDIIDYNNGLPAPVNQAIAGNFTGYTIDKAHMITWKDRSAYDLKLKNGDKKMKVLVDTNGNILKQKDK